jgi:hypothetical protein
VWISTSRGELHRAYCGDTAKMKFRDDRTFPTPEAAERKLLELANAVETDHAGRLSVEIVNPPIPRGWRQL